MDINEIKRRLQVKGFAEDELKVLFPTDEELVQFYRETVLQAKTVGNKLSAEEEKDKDDYKLNAEEKREFAATITAKKKKAKKLAASATSGSKAEFKAAGAHLGADAGTPADLARVRKQLEEIDLEDDDEDDEA